MILKDCENVYGGGVFRSVLHSSCPILAISIQEDHGEGAHSETWVSVSASSFSLQPLPLLSLDFWYSDNRVK